MIWILYYQFRLDCPAGFTTQAKSLSDLNAYLKLAVIIIYTIVAILLLVAIELLRRRRSLCFGKMKNLKNDKVCVFSKRQVTLRPE